MKLYAGRCPVCRCTRLHRDSGWAEMSFLGFTIGVVRDAPHTRTGRNGLTTQRPTESHPRWQTAGRKKSAAQDPEACIYCGRRHLGIELPDCPGGAEEWHQR